MENATGLSLLTAAQLLAADLPPPSDVLAPLLASGTAALVYGPSGIGKSFFALGVAWAVASGGSFLSWRAPRPRRVLYVDGELGAATLRERLALFGPPPGRLMFSAPDLGPESRPGSRHAPLLDLSETAGIVRLMSAWRDPELVILDSLSTLAGLGGADPDCWHRLQRFLLHQRTHRRAVLMVHHVNKEGELHGTTKRENALDLMMALRRPESQLVSAIRTGNARFEVHFEKTRSRRGAPLMPVLAELQTDEVGRGSWRWGPAEGSRLERAAALLNRGLSVPEAANALGIGRSLLFRLKAEARRAGLLNPGRGP